MHEPDQSDEAASHPWSRLWRNGVLHSCATAMADNYGGAIASFWDAVFTQAEAGERIVDIGTGNGAVLLLAKENATRRGVKFALHGVDLADIDPPASLPGGHELYAGISFHPRTSATSLPFATGHVDLLTAQYALEYAPREATLREAVRVIRPGGRIALMMHSSDSVIADVTARQLDNCRHIFMESRLFDATRTMLTLLARAHTPAERAALADDPAAEAIRNRLNSAAEGVIARARHNSAGSIPDRAIEAARHALQMIDIDPLRAKHQLHAVELELQHEWQRLQHMEHAVLDAPALRALAETLHQAGFTEIVLAPLDQRPGARMGWTLVARHG